MAIVTHSRRVTRRFTISKTDEARVELGWPSPGGRRFDLPLVDLSISGISFRFREPLAGLDSGSSIPAVVVRLGKSAIRGDLLVMHLTELPSGETQCGALFYPAEDADLLQLKSAVAGIEAVIGD